MVHDHIASLIGDSPEQILQSLAQRVKERRLEKNLTQKALAARAGVSFGSYRRFETSGELSLRGLVMVAWALDMTAEFATLFAATSYQSMDELLELKKNKTRKRATRRE